MSRARLRPALRQAMRDVRALVAEGEEGGLTLVTTKGEGFLFYAEMDSEQTYHVCWGDGNSEDVTSFYDGHQYAIECEHNYSDNDPYQVVVTGNLAALLFVSFEGMALTEINPSGLTGLVALSVTDNNLTTLDVSACASLEELSCDHNTGLTTLNLTGCPAFVGIDSQDTSLSSVDLSGNPLLRRFCFRTSAIAAIDLSHNPLLEDIDLSEGPLASLDVTTNPLLRSLFAYDCNLSTPAVDAILIALAAHSVYDGQVWLQDNSPIGEGGLVAKATLQGRRWTVRP